VSRYQNVAENDLRLLEDYYKRNPVVEKDGWFKGNKQKGKIIGNKKGDVRQES